MADSVDQSQKPRKSTKNRRVARACDECRMRKSRCSGLQPCEACDSTDRYCTYNLSAGRSTGSGTRIRILEDRLRRARAYLNEAKKRTPSMADINFDALLGPMEELAHTDPKPARQDADKDDDDLDDQGRLESMMDAYGQMDLAGKGRDFYGAASGLAWIQKTRDYFEDPSSTTSDPDDHPPVENASTVQLFDAPLPSAQTLPTDPSIPHILPPRETATRLLNVVFAQVYPMFHFLSEDDFHESTDRIYSKDHSKFEEDDQSFLPLFYVVMALGYLFSREEHSQLGCRVSVSQASMRYFIAARKMVDIAHLRTVVSLQVVISIILYLVSTARMASAHAFLGAACAAAMRQGLHFRSTHEAQFPEKERRVRRKIFWAVMNLDGYITSILGLPPFLDATAVDPAIDLTVEAALKEGRAKKIHASLDGSTLISSDGVALMASAKHIELMRVIFKAQRTLFPKPIDPPDVDLHNGKISVSIRKLRTVESQLREWAQSLTDVLNHPDSSIEIESIKYELQICYYFANIVLYRPFLHYLAKPHRDQSSVERERTYATTCTAMARRVVEISVDHQRKGLLCPASWSAVYTAFLSVVCLVFEYATRKEGTEDEKVRKDIEDGIRLLASTACTTDTGSVRCLEILRRLLKRVSYAVDIDLDELYSATKPCCTIDFSSRVHGAKLLDLTELHIARTTPSKAHRQTSIASSMHSGSSNGQHLATSPGKAAIKSSLLEVDDGSHNPGQQSPPSEDEQMVDIPHGGMFDWEGTDVKESVSNTEASTDPHSQQHQRSFSTSQGMQPRLTPQDIANFMHTSPLDEHFGRRTQ